MRTSTMSAAEIDTRNHRRAVRFFWTWLILASCVSLAGNVLHAWHTAPADTRWIAACVAAVPPTVLLLAVHGLAVLARVSASGRVYRASVAATGMVAVSAFILSFVALRELAVIAGIRPALAPVLPLVIDLAIGVATLALVAIGDKPARHARTATRCARTPAAIGATPNSAPTIAPTATTATISRDTAAPSGTENASITVNDQTRELAATLVTEKVTRQPVETVVRILAAHDAGDPLNRIAKNIGVHHSAVARVIDAAAAHHQRVLEAV